MTDAALRSSGRLSAVLAGAVLLSLAGSPALAQNPLAGDWTVTIGAEGLVVPQFSGSDEYEIRPRPIFSVRRAGTTAVFKAPDDGISFALFDTQRFRIGPVGRFNAGRDQDDAPILRGLGDIDFSVEAGLFAEVWTSDYFRLRGELRRGFGGHHGFIADLGADFVMRPADRWLVSIGPRISVADSEYMETFYGVNAAQSVRSGLLAYNPSGGFQKAGVIASANYQLTPNWTVLGFARYDRLVGEAADSPLVQVGGSENQFSTGLGVSYSFDVNLFR